MDFLQILFRWMHVFAGIIWIGHLYFFNFVNGPMAAVLDAEVKRKVVPELMPRALFWFRWGAFWTWMTGVLLLMLVFYHGGILFNEGETWSIAAYVMIALTFVSPFIYDALAKSGFAQKKKAFAIVCLLLLAVIGWAMSSWEHFSYRAYNIHVGALLGTIMAWNVWYRIWPNQQKIISAVKGGQAPDAALVATAGTRSRHNTFMSVALLWTMINQHTTFFSGGNWGLTEHCAWIVLPVVTAVAWHIVGHCYKKAAKVTGF